MRFIELLTLVAVVTAAVSAAPTQDKRDIMELEQPLDKKAFVFDPKRMNRASKRRRIHKRTEIKDCCGNFGINLGGNLAGKLDLSAGGGGGAGFKAAENAAVAPAPVAAPPPPAPPAPPAAPVNRNDRNGDSVVVVVDAKHG